MFKYTIKRVLQSLLTVLIVVSIVSLLLSLMPTDYYFTEDELMKLTDEQKNAILSAAGLLDNPFEQLFHFLKNLFLHGDLGVSRRIQAGVPVLTVIGGKFGISMKMGSIALVISLLLGVPMGILQAKYKNGAFDNAGTVYTIFVNAVPSLVSYSLVLVLGVKVFGLPSMYSTRQALRSSIMPVICLALGSIASYALWMRRYMIDELTKDYIKLAKIKGLSSRTIMFRHVLRNAFVPMAQNLPSSFMLTISGSLLVERFFSVPGMGPLLTDAITRYDLIGFLAAGTIIVTGRQEVKGLTTAAGLWASACMGIAIGAGFYECVVIAFVLMFLCIHFLPVLEVYLLENARNMNIYVELKSLDEIGVLLGAVKTQNIQIYGVEIDRGGEEHHRYPSAVLSVRLEHHQQHPQVLAALSEITGVIMIEEI